MSGNHDTSESLVRQAYFFILRRAPDVNGLPSFQRYLDSSEWQLRDLYFSLLVSDEFKARILSGPYSSVDHFKIFLGLEDPAVLRRVENGLRGLEPWPDVARSIAETMTSVCSGNGV